MLRTTLLAATAGLVVGLDANVYGQASPVVSWSGIKNFYGAGDTVVTDNVAVEDLSSYFQANKDVSHPKVAVVFSYKDLATNSFSEKVQSGELAGLQEAVEDGTSALMVPNTFGAGGGVSDLISGLPSALNFDTEATISFFAAGKDAVTTHLESSAIFDFSPVSPNAWMETLESVQSPVFFYFHVGPDSDAIVTEVMAAVKKTSGNDYVAFAVPGRYEISRAAAKRQLEATSLGATSTALYGVRMTPNIMLGLLVSVFLFFMAYVGLAKMADIRPNDKFWTDENVPLGHKVEM